MRAVASSLATGPAVPAAWPAAAPAAVPEPEPATALVGAGAPAADGFTFVVVGMLAGAGFALAVVGVVADPVFADVFVEAGFELVVEGAVAAASLPAPGVTDAPVVAGGLGPTEAFGTAVAPGVAGALARFRSPVACAPGTAAPAGE